MTSEVAPVLLKHWSQVAVNKCLRVVRRHSDGCSTLSRMTSTAAVLSAMLVDNSAWPAGGTAQEEGQAD
jgi:hypothetical protein